MSLRVVTLPLMRRLMAAVLLLCLGILIPAGGTPVRLCLLEGRVLPHHAGGPHAETPPAASKCCQDCRDEPESPQPCCIDLKELPESTAPPVPVELPALDGVELEMLPWAGPPVLPEPAFIPVMTTEIRGPTPPALRRAMLSVWRL